MLWKTSHSPFSFLETQEQETGSGCCGTKLAFASAQTTIHNPSTDCIKCCKLVTCARSMRNWNSGQYIWLLFLYSHLKGSEIHIFTVILCTHGWLARQGWLLVLLEGKYWTFFFRSYKFTFDYTFYIFGKCIYNISSIWHIKSKRYSLCFHPSSFFIVKGQVAFNGLDALFLHIQSNWESEEVPVNWKLANIVPRQEGWL